MSTYAKTAADMTKAHKLGAATYWQTQGLPEADVKHRLEVHDKLVEKKASRFAFVCNFVTGQSPEVVFGGQAAAA